MDFTWYSDHAQHALTYIPHLKTSCICFLIICSMRSMSMPGSVFFNGAFFVQSTSMRSISMSGGLFQWDFLPIRLTCGLWLSKYVSSHQNKIFRNDDESKDCFKNKFPIFLPCPIINFSICCYEDESIMLEISRLLSC